MRSVAAHVLCAPDLLRRICAFHVDEPQQILCRSLLRRTYKHDDDDVAVDGPSISAWLLVHGATGLPSLCAPHLFAYAITCGDANALQWLADAGLLTWTKALLVLDARDCKACPRAVEDLGPAMKICSSNNVVRAATKGHVDVLAFLHDNAFAMDDDIWKAVCAGGHLNVARYVVMQGLGVWNDAYMNVAAANGHFELLRYLLGLGYDGVNGETLTLAIEHDQLATVQDLLARGPSQLVSFQNALKNPVVYRRVDILRWLCKQLEARASLDVAKAMAVYYCAPAALQCISDAIARQSTEQRFRSVLLSQDLLTSIVSYQIGFDGSTVALHALCKDLALYRNYDRDVPTRDSYGAYHAHFTLWQARHGLAQLHNLCAPHLFAYAMAYGNIEILNALGPDLLAPEQRVELNCRRSRVCLRSKDQVDHCDVAYSAVVVHAASSGLVDLLAMLHDAGFAMDNVWLRVCYFGHLNIAQFAHDRQLPGWQPIFIYYVAASGHLNVVQFFHEHNFNGFDENTIGGAVCSSNTDLVQFLLTHRPNECTLRDAMTSATNTDNLEMVMWLCGQPEAAHVVDEALRCAYVSRSHRCIAYLGSLPHARKATIQLFERVFQRKASEMS